MRSIGGGQLNAHGTISQKAHNLLPLVIEAEGILKADELIAFFAQELLKGFSMEGSITFSTMLRGDPTSFVLETDMDLTETFWDLPTFIKKLRPH